MTLWSEKWKSMEDWLQEIESNLIKSRARVRRGGIYDKWDLQVSCGFFSSGRAILTIEEHGGGKQLLRFKCVPHYSVTGIVFITLLSMLSFLAIADASYIAGSILGFFAITLGFTYFTDKARAMYDLSKAFTLLTEPEKVSQTKVVVLKRELAEELIPIGNLAT